MKKSGGRLRKVARSPINARVRLVWDDERGTSRMCYGKCVDISEKGLRVQLDESIPVRSYVQFEIREMNFRGSASVRFMGRKGMRNEVGLEFSQSVQWEWKDGIPTQQSARGR